MVKKKKKSDDTNDIRSYSLLQIENDIGDAGAISLSQALKGNTTLTTLSLCGQPRKSQFTTHTYHISTYSQATIFEMQEYRHFVNY